MRITEGIKGEVTKVVFGHTVEDTSVAGGGGPP